MALTKPYHIEIHKVFVTLNVHSRSFKVIQSKEKIRRKYNEKYIRS